MATIHYSSGMIALSIVGALLAIVLLLYLPSRQAMVRGSGADRNQVPEAKFVGVEPGHVRGGGGRYGLLSALKSFHGMCGSV